jgi:hypothetical protein
MSVTLKFMNQKIDRRFTNFGVLKNQKATRRSHLELRCVGLYDGFTRQLLAHRADGLPAFVL